ncbi:hypothetical protein CFS9_11700 [Flavobacterium sp. CFS9]|uniref:Phytanoyl-CoA dioxygenase n=1 Tax=Flavobacterium sp. CFS9 TaxID=3143118 RepID=A0AAT9GZA9_9FLAO
MNSFEQNGYVFLENFFSENELAVIEKGLVKFHEIWLRDNEISYEKGVLNSHSLTKGDGLTEEEKTSLFEFIAQDKFEEILSVIFPKPPVFLNTQLFFDPKDEARKNYWHRDIQYTGMSVEDQKEAIKTQNVVHFRIPMKTERGIELIPTTHREWDLPEEFEVRNSLKGRLQSDDLKRGEIVRLNRGDLLIFSANMIHRGIYGKDRFSLDIIFCDNIPQMKAFIDKDNLPSAKILEKLKNKPLFDI